MEKLIKFILPLTIFLCLLSFVWLLKALFLGLYPDFSGYYFGSKYLLEGRNPYIGGGNLYTSYVYPPIVLLLFIPFQLINFQTAEIMWTCMSLSFLVGSLFLLSKIFEIKFFSKLNMLFMTLVFLSFPTKFTLGMGQINMLVLGLIVYSLWLIKQKREFASGIVLGVSLAVKLFPVFLPVYLLLKLEKKIIAGILASLIASILLVVIFVPLKIYSGFLDIIPTFFSSWKLDYYNQSLAGFIGRSFGTGELAIALKSIISLLVIFATFFVVLKKGKKDFLTVCLKFGIVITASLLVNTFSWQHHFVWMIVPFYCTLFYLRKNNYSKKYFVLVLISYLLISINFPNPNVLPIILRSHVFYGGVLLFALQTYLLFKNL